jgi:rubrerythrin
VDIDKLRRLARDVDEQHRTAMTTFADEMRDGPLDHHRIGRRALLQTGAVVTVAGAAIAFGPFADAALAATTGSTTTTTPPVAPNDADLKLLAFGQSIELVLVAAYEAAIATGKLADDVKKVAEAFANHHREHAAALSAIAGKAAPGRANSSLLGAFGPQFQAAVDQNELLKLAFQVETSTSATYLGLLGELTGTRGAGLVASILPIESAHAVVLGQTLGLDQAKYLPSFELVVAPFDPADYPL